MKKYINSTLTLIALVVLLTSCDIINAPYEKKPDTTGNVITVNRKVLIEDFTGFRCGNCHEAREIGDKIHEKYGDKVIVIGIHAGGLAIPTPTRKYDFRTPEGNELETFYKLPATPYGMVNRVPINGDPLQGPSAWETSVLAQFKLESPVDLKLTASYNDVTKEISMNAGVKYLKAGNPNYYIASYIVEDSVDQYQKDDRLSPNVNIDHYNHMHVLRGAMSGTWGSAISSVVVNSGATVNVPIKFTIPSTKDWVPKHLSLIVFVHDNSNKQILQVDKIKLIN